MTSLPNKDKWPIIALDHTFWNGNWMNRQQLLSRLGDRGWPIIYSNGALFVRESHLKKPFNKVVHQDNISLLESGAIVPRNYKFQMLDNMAIRYHCRLLKKSLGIRTKDQFIGLCFNPDFYPYFRELQPSRLMFHIYDVYSKMGASAQENNSLELLESADLITAASEFMWDEVVQDKQRPMAIIHNGVDYNTFRNPAETDSVTIKKIQNISGPKIGYAGAINPKVDFELVRTLANKFTNVQFIFVGNVLEGALRKDPKTFTSYSSCKNIQNIHFLGRVDKTEVPGVLATMDINCIYYRQDEDDWVKSGYPLKINEYLAAGKPIVTSYMPVLEKYFSEQVAICRNVTQWEDKICDALSGSPVGSIKSRRELAKANDWESRVDMLETLMFQMIS